MKKYIAIFLFVLFPLFASASTANDQYISLLTQLLNLYKQQLIVLQQELAQLQNDTMVVQAPAPIIVQESQPVIINRSVTPTTMPTQITSNTPAEEAPTTDIPVVVEKLVAPTMSVVPGSIPDTVHAGNYRIRIATVEISAAPEDLIFWGPRPGVMFTGNPATDPIETQFSYQNKIVWNGDPITIKKGQKANVAMYITVPTTLGDLSFDTSAWQFAGAISGDVYELTGDAIGTVKVVQ